MVQERIKTSENGFLNIGDEGDYELSGVQDLSDDVQCPIQLNDAQVCINEDIVITGSMSLLGNAEIYIMNADGTQQTRLTNTFDIDEWATSLSPDGTKIAFESDRDGTVSYTHLTLPTNREV